LGAPRQTKKRSPASQSMPHPTIAPVLKILDLYTSFSCVSCVPCVLCVLCVLCVSCAVSSGHEQRKVLVGG
jgi:hypothetical protein